ncbi:MAG: diphthine--ammonia ligase [Euryarchaeota archaeon]|nr:diphthine--ammonia ligase [Euryarchaeota archaeon]MBT4050648.1 diphthine--ammonia ligase [Euryarchaeota archaeon]MBT4346425.1 diphthine--ammonia ligase [Euryarchaeota archaeon]MBT4650780.1 diphthine--ammonia ligase [Euryarchaeota archaeon]MBT4961741.1 diphthine--ammonia ligase [Euryarchaeota archaeon]
MRTAVLASGGKDSTYASWWALMQGWSIEAMVTIQIVGNDSMMFQLQNTTIAGLQAKSIGVPWISINSEGIEEAEIEDLENAIISSNLQIDALVVGALRSDYQKTRIERMCQRLGIISYCPLWHHDSLEHMNSLIDHGFDVRIVSVSADGLDDSWLGAKLTGENLPILNQLAKKHRFNLDGEGGEFETIVLDAPHMNQRIICEAETTWNGSRGTWLVTNAHLE